MPPRLQCLGCGAEWQGDECECSCKPGDANYEEWVEVVIYDREVLVDVLVHHWPDRNNACECGWAKLGASYPGHIADVYEHVIAGKEHVMEHAMPPRRAAEGSERQIATARLACEERHVPSAVSVIAHVVLGMEQDEWDAVMSRGGSTLVTDDPGWHSHPVLGIPGHLHKDGRRPHAHHPKWDWDMDHSIPLVAEARRLPECVKRWPECEDGGYDPRCCRFPKSCSPAAHITDVGRSDVSWTAKDLL